VIPARRPHGLIGHLLRIVKVVLILAYLFYGCSGSWTILTFEKRN